MVETERHMGSLQKTADGEPIEFVGLSFAISREEWAALGRESEHVAESDGF